MVAWVFLPQNFGRWQGPRNHLFAWKCIQFEWCWQSEVVGTLKPYLYQLNSLKYLYYKVGGQRKPLSSELMSGQKPFCPGERAFAQVKGIALRQKGFHLGKRACTWAKGLSSKWKGLHLGKRAFTQVKGLALRQKGFHPDKRIYTCVKGLASGQQGFHLDKRDWAWAKEPSFRQRRLHPD